MKQEKDYSHRKFVNTHYMTRESVVPFYVNLIMADTTDTEVCRVNELILSKWSSSGLVYIKNKAWKRVKAIRALEHLKREIIK